MSNNAMSLPGSYFLPSRVVANMPTPEKLTEIRGTLDAVKRNSDDPDTQIGCVITDEYFNLLITGVNRLPIGVSRLTHRVTRPTKNDFIMHAERHAVASAAKIGTDLEGGCMFLNWYPCADCAQVIIQAGIRRLFVERDALMARVSDPRYKFTQAAEMLDDAAVQVIWW
jgi:dCMP deaminase